MSSPARLLLSLLTCCTALAQGWLGIYLEPESERPRVAEAIPGSPAYNAGLRPGDLLVALDGKPLEGRDALIAAVRSRKAGDRVRLGIERGGNEMLVVVRLGERPAEEEIPEPAQVVVPSQPLEPPSRQEPRTQPAPRREASTRGGAPLAEARPGSAFLGAELAEDDDGLVVTRTIPDGPAARAGLRAGDRILRFGTTDVRTLQQVQARLQGARPGDRLQLHVVGEGDPRIVLVELGSRAGAASPQPAAPTVPAMPPMPAASPTPVVPAAPAVPAPTTEQALLAELEQLRAEVRELRRLLEELKKGRE